MDNRNSRNSRENTFYGEFTEQETAVLNEAYGQWIFWKVPRHGKIGYYAWSYEWPKDLRIVDRDFVAFRNKVMSEGEVIRESIEAEVAEVADVAEVAGEQVSTDVKNIRKEFDEKGIVDESRNVDPYVEAEAELDKEFEQIEFKMSAVPITWSGEFIEESTESTESTQSTQPAKPDEQKYSYDESLSREENMARYLSVKRRI